MPCTSTQLRCRLANAYNAATNWRVPQKTTPHSALLTPNYKIIRSFDALSIAAPRPPGHPHLTATPTAKNPTKSAPVKSPLPTSNTPTPRHQANRPHPHRVSIFSPKKQKFLKKIARSRKQPQAIFKQFSIRTAASPPAPEEKHSPHPPDQHICTSAHKHTSDRPYFPGEIHIPRAPADSC